MVTVVYCSRVVTVEWEIVHGNKLNLPCGLTGVIQTQNFLYHYTNLTVVRESVTGRSMEAIRPARKSFVSLHRWTWTLHQAAH